MSGLFSNATAINFILLMVVLVSISSFLYFHRRLSTKYQSLENQLQQIQNEIRAINSGNLGMGRTITRFAEDIANVEINSSQSDMSNVNEKIYRQAGLLLERGATVEEVVESCEITPSEAELLAVMHHSSHVADKMRNH